MNKTKKNWKGALILGLILLFMMSVTALASSDNSLSALNVENGTVSPDFVYSTWEYDVKVAPGTTELSLNPTTSDSNASVTSIEGTTLDNGTGTVLITVTAENGSAFTYTLHVSVDESLAPETESETEPATEAPTEAPTQAVTETPATEITQNEAYIKLNNQVNSYKERLDLSMKIIYGLIAFSVLLLFIIINQILKNKDLKDDLRDMEEMGANMGGYGQETYGDNGNYYEEPAKPMTRKEKKQVKKEEKQRAKEEKRNKKKGNQPEQQQDAYQNPGNGAYQPEQDGRQMNYQDPAPQTWQQGPQTWQQQPVYQQAQQPTYQQQPVYQQQNPYQQAEPVNQAPQQQAPSMEEAFAPQAQPENQGAADGEKKDVDVTMVEL